MEIWAIVVSFMGVLLLSASFAVVGMAWKAEKGPKKFLVPRLLSRTFAQSARRGAPIRRAHRAKPMGDCGE